MARTAIAGLCRIEFPTRTVLLAEGGVIRWGADIFREKDAVFGSIMAVENLSEGLGKEVPALVLTLTPPAASAPSDLSQPGFQTSPVRFWLARFDVATGEVTGTPDLQFAGQVDQTDFSLRRELTVTVVSEAERLFEMNKGSPLSPVFHKDLFPGETGHDNATGLSRPVAWGTESPGGSTGRTNWWGAPIGSDGGGAVPGRNMWQAA